MWTTVNTSASPPSQLCRSSHHAGRRRSPVLRDEKKNPNTSAATARTVATIPVDRLRYQLTVVHVTSSLGSGGGVDIGSRIVTVTPCPRVEVELDCAVVGGDDRFDDRHPEPGAAGLTRSRGVGPVEALEHAGSFVRIHAGTVVAHRDDGLVAVGAEVDGRLRAGGGVRSNVGEQVVDHLA